MTTYGDWADAVISQLASVLDHPDADIPDDRAEWLTSWAAHEDTRARFNPLATTLRLHGSTDFNSAGVQDYGTLGQGVHAVVGTLLGHDAAERGYTTVVRDLLHPGSSYRDFRHAVSFSAWGPERGDYWIPVDPVDWTDKNLP